MIKFDGKTLFRVIFLAIKQTVKKKKKKERKERRFTGTEKPHLRLLWSSVEKKKKNIQKKCANTHKPERDKVSAVMRKAQERDRKSVRVDV